MALQSVPELRVMMELFSVALLSELDFNLFRAGAAAGRARALAETNPAAASKLAKATSAINAAGILPAAPGPGASSTSGNINEFRRDASIG